MSCTRPLRSAAFLLERIDVGRDAGVVEHVGRQGDDGLEQVAFEEVAADLALAGTGAAGEERGAVQDDADAGAAGGSLK
jgi:hypothetical protein